MMEKTATEYFAIVKWWTGLKREDKLFAFMSFVILSLSTVCVKQYGEIKMLNNDKYIDVIECEKRGSAKAASDIMIERKRTDSIVTAEREQCEIEKQNFFKERTTVIKTGTQKIENELK